MRAYLLSLTLAATLVTGARAADITQSRQTAASKQARAGESEFRALYEELVEINTTRSAGSCTRAAEAIKARLAKAGFAE
jgi:hypothetical protein